MKLSHVAVAVMILCVCASAWSRQKQARPERPPEKGKPEGAPEYRVQQQPHYGENLALTIEKLKNGLDPKRKLLIWGIGSSYTNMLGRVREFDAMVREHWPNAPEIEYKVLVGNSVPWSYIRGWARHLVAPDQPDVVLTYTIGRSAELDALLAEIRKSTTADIIVPTIHWRERCRPNWEKGLADAPDQNIAEVKTICTKYGAEYVENRELWAEYLKKNNLKIEDLIKDSVHQSQYGAEIIRRNIGAHLHEAKNYRYDPRERERRLAVLAPQSIRAGESVTLTADWQKNPPSAETDKKGASIAIKFQGIRCDVIGTALPGGGTASVKIDGKPADQIPAFFMTYVEPAKGNNPGSSPTRDRAPHGVTLGDNVVPQDWTITMTSDDMDYTIEGSVTGPDGAGNARELFKSKSGQIVIEPELWRWDKKGNRINFKGDVFTFKVYRSTLGEVGFKGTNERFRAKVAQNLENGQHTLEITANGDGKIAIEAFDVFEPADLAKIK